MVRIVLLLATVGLFVGPLAAWASEDAKADVAGSEDFEKTVRPLLAANCLDCHGPEKQKAGLRLDSRAGMIEGGDSGPVLRPGDPEGSRLIEVIRHDADVQMPPRRKLADEEIAILSDWVRAGAPWPGTARPTRAPSPDAGPKVTAEDRAFWSFRPIRAVGPPAVKDGSWPSSALDRFILAKLEQKGLRPVAPADKRTLIRRATFDLIGLPPTAEEVEAFADDPDPLAYDRLIDRLLASPHYGERWGRHWLDIARYGEDQAHSFKPRLYPFGYRYRDWVVKALNEDMPYDQFVREQVAGDLIEGPGREDRLAATGFFALGPVYYGNAVFDELDDRVDTLTRGFLGLTVACARCHDHKFDPIPQRDYYSLAGIFASTDYKEHPAVPAEVVARYEQAQAAIKAKENEIAASLQAESGRWSESAASRTASYMVAAWTLANRRKADPKLPTADVASKEDLEGFLLDRWVKYLFDEETAKRPYLARWRRMLAAQDSKADLSGDESARSEVAVVAGAFEAHVLATLKLRDALKQHREAASANSVEGAKTPSPEGPDADLLREVVSADGLFGLPKERGEKYLSEEVRKSLNAKRDELSKLKEDAPPKYPVIHALADGKAPADMRIHLRGNPKSLGEEAPRHGLEVLSETEPRPFTQGSGRLELAREIASPDNPLTARVIVNRAWEHHFGRGLVATPSNFGRLGERPSHPELLDHLAARFIASGWSLKALHREIMRSSTYRLDSRSEPSNHEVDPDDVLLWRANRRRLEVEAWRDAMLAASGELDRAIGGPSIDLGAAENRRRTFYASVSRHNLDGLLRLFDFPDPNLTSDRRAVTTVPLQQLFVLNSPFMERRAKALAARLTSGPDQPDERRIGRAFLELYSRPPSDREVRLGLEFLAAPETPTDGEPAPALSRWEQYAQVLLGSNEFAYVD